MTKHISDRRDQIQNDDHSVERIGSMSLSPGFR